MQPGRQKHWHIVEVSEGFLVRPVPSFGLTTLTPKQQETLMRVYQRVQLHGI
jgi:hypothetical protein